MMIRHSLIAAALAALPLGLFTGAASAQQSPDLSRVEVEGRQLPKLSRTDVHKVCTHMDSTLQEKLARAWFNNQTEGEVRVQFQLQGGQVSEVIAKGGPLAYRQAIRQAVHYLDCQADASATQQFAFVVAFQESDETPGDMKMALLERQ